MMIKVIVLTLCLFLGIGNALDVEDCSKDLSRDQYLQYHNGLCYEFVVNTRRTFWNAETDCERKGGRLLIITSKELNDYIWTQLTQVYQVRSATWIGLYKSQRDDAFIWVDGTDSKYYFTNWGYNQGPLKVYHGRDEDCVSMDPVRGTWYDLDCDHNSIFGHTNHARYVCQYNPIAHITNAPTSSRTPVTMAPTTMAPTTQYPTTIVPKTTMAPRTMTTTTQAPSTKAPTNHPLFSRSTTKLITILKPTCPPFICNLDCGMDGYMENDAGCSLCECDV